MKVLARLAPIQRFALFVLSAAVVLLFVGFAIAQGIGHPSIPSGDVAVIEDAPEGLGTVSEQELRHAIEIAAAAAQMTPAPKPGDKKYDELREAALGEIFDSIWIQGQAAEMGFSATPREVAKELKKLKKQAFKTEKQYREFLKESHYTKKDVDDRVKVQILSTKIQKQLSKEKPAPSRGEIEDYYEAAKSSQFTTPENRDVRTIGNKDKQKVEEAKATLLKDDSAKNWKRVAKQYSSKATKSSGGLQSGLTEGRLPEPLDAAVFAAPQGAVEGPVKTEGNYTIFEIETIVPEKVQPLKEVESQISSQLAEQASQQNFAGFIRNYSGRWKSRTFCAPGFLIERCANFKGSGRPKEANHACYEANPETPAEACPAPVGGIKPAQPGSTTVLSPEGQKLAQRPRPAGGEEAGTPAGALPSSAGAVPAPTE